VPATVPTTKKIMPRIKSSTYELILSDHKLSNSQNRLTNPLLNT